MKKFLLITLLSAIGSNSFGLDTLGKYLGLDAKRSAPLSDPYDDKGIDNVAFWSTAVTLFEKDGKHPEFVSHAKTQLRRAQTLSLHERGLGKTGRTSKSYSTLAIAKEKERLKREQDRLKEELKKARASKPSTKSQQDAFERGKKAGQAKQRRIFKKKAEDIKARMDAQKRAKKA